MNEILRHYAELITDPAHTLVELTFNLVVDGLLLGILWPLLKRRFRREHEVLDAEHGVTHPEPAEEPLEGSQWPLDDDDSRLMSLVDLIRSHGIEIVEDDRLPSGTILYFPEREGSDT